MPMTVSAEYRSKVHKPDDFDAFWDDVASAIPLDAEVVPDPLRTSEDVEVFQVFYTSLFRSTGGPVDDALARPRAIVLADSHREAKGHVTAERA